ncbi:histidine phosphatase family protein [Vibrio gazogenes]|uniref:Probable phosphoglycerate mutase n=1 Tax=Vibrio gazogenes DSM 21264 = NBRC 103151 TaxID=1123492 RepID=A0A1M5HLK8_VIBGA|nr:histidine phosphatase family protein [Vibrio gazogenes]USP14509.1 histidine phosphatase family protein [Vibrio gazogenes]SHG16845.1 probable phosphoglycerate mutase [Vibrio gazogenes DSM 21264] [Vibrio gazogenes DSM 21264 = NBRC 103151]SJN56599.1 Phosphoserine phosphatase 1 [Vibrio gazogenes]
MEIHLVRHGETVANKEKRMQGVTDTPLTDLGISQARELEKNLSQYKFDLCMSSPLKRAKDTARIVTNERQPIIVNDDLIELDFGSWEGVKKRDVESLYPVDYEMFWNFPHCYKPKSGESFQEAGYRIKKFLDVLKKEHGTKTLLIVTHAIVIKTILIKIENRCLSTMWDAPFVHNCFHTIREI